MASRVSNSANSFAGLSKKTIAEMSERGTVWIFNRALVGNMVYRSVDDIKKDPNFRQLKQIWNGNVPDAWLVSYYKQQEQMLKKFGSQQWTRFRYGSGSFMDFIKDILKSINKDSSPKLRYEQWNPSDIWMIKRGATQRIKKEIQKNVKGRSQTINELNDLLKDLIRRQELIGISLKKIGSGDAKFIYVNIDISGIESLIRNNAQNLSVKKIVYEIEQLQSVVEFTNGDRIQITNNSGQNKPDNLKFEANIKGSSGKGGKASVKSVINLLKSQGKTFVNNYREYPKDVEEYKNQKEYENIFSTLKLKGIIKNNITFEMFNDRILNLYENEKPYFAITKLMELKFLYKCLDLNDTDEFWTDVYYLGLKVGSTFAPHGKLY